MKDENRMLDFIDLYGNRTFIEDILIFFFRTIGLPTLVCLNTNLVPSDLPFLSKKNRRVGQ